MKDAFHQAIARKFPPVVLAFNENAWANNPAKFAATMERIASRKFANRAAAIRFCWFGSPSGKRLRRAFGDALSDLFVWECVTPQVGGTGAEKFPVDVDHVRRVIAAHRPDLVVTFGVPARQALAAIWSGRLICCDHPSPRNPRAPADLAAKKPLILAAIRSIKRKRACERRKR